MKTALLLMVGTLCVAAAAEKKPGVFPVGPGYYQPSAEERRLCASPFFGTTVDPITKDVIQACALRGGTT